jgi:hypothetical protein
MRPVATALVLAALATAACSRPELDDPTRYTVIVGDDEHFTEPTSIEADGVALHARAEGNVLILSFRNDRPDEVTVTLDDLLVLSGPDRQRDVHPLTPVTADIRAFTPIILKPGERAVRLIPMRLDFPLRGHRVAYYNRRQSIKARAVIE